jgi:hypothetical protein
MAKKKRTVHCKITFDENGKVIKVQGNDKDVEGKPGPEPGNPVGVCKVMVLEDDDPCVTQGGIRWCW